MPSGPKKRKADKRKKERASASVDHHSVVAAEEGTRPGSPVATDDVDHPVMCADEGSQVATDVNSLTLDSHWVDKEVVHSVENVAERDDAANNRGGGHKPDSKNAESSVDSSPEPVERESWKTCCGLFQVLSDTNT